METQLKWQLLGKVNKTVVCALLNGDDADNFIPNHHYY